MVLKKTLLSVMAVAIMVIAMAFTQSGKSNEPKAKLAAKRDYSYYFRYTGPSNPINFSDYINVNNYVLLGDEESPGDFCDAGYDEVCVILCPRVWHGPSGSWKPDFSDTSEIGIRYNLYRFYLVNDMSWLGIYYKSL